MEHVGELKDTQIPALWNELESAGITFWYPGCPPGGIFLGFWSYLTLTLSRPNKLLKDWEIIHFNKQEKVFSWTSPL